MARPKDIRRLLAQRALGPAGLVGPLVSSRSAAKVLLGQDSRRLLRGWQAAGNAWAEGYYDRAVELRRQLLAEADELWPADSEATTMMSIEWISNMGHLGWLHAYFENSDRVQTAASPIITLGTPGNRHLFGEVFSGRPKLSLGPLASLLDLPPLWPVSERLSTIRAQSGYLDMYHVWESLYGEEPSPLMSTAPKAAKSDCDSSTGELANDLVDLIKRPYVLWLNRQSSDPRDPRFSPEESWTPALDHLRTIGYQIVRMGHAASLERLPRSVVDMTVTSDLNRDGRRDLELLRGCDFMMSSNSGPVVVAAALRIPTLQVNTIAVARNMISSPSTFLSLPKHHMVSGRVLSASEIFGGNYGYMERPNDSRGLRLLPNSSAEILSGVRDLLNALTGWPSATTGTNEASTEFLRLRKEFESVSLGQVAPSFLARNHEWLN